MLFNPFVPTVTFKRYLIRLKSIHTQTRPAEFQNLILGSYSVNQLDLIFLGQDLFLDKHLHQFGIGVQIKYAP